MKQVLQSMATGETQLTEIPCPQAREGEALIATSTTLVSAGTERMLVDFGKASWVSRARKHPDKVKMVLDKVKTDGLSPTLEAVRAKLEQPMPLGYCSVGRVIAAPGTGFSSGDRVVSNGSHVEVARVPNNLCALIPPEVDDETAAFTVIGAIALQGIRLLSPTIGETVVVTGLGLVGLMAVQILRANGCRVLGIDFDSSRCRIARSFGAETVNLSKGEDPISIGKSFSNGRGVDGVIVAASTSDNTPIKQAATMCRKRGRIVLVGVVGLELSRADFYEKELTFQVSCSYGPGRYDTEYEDKGNDYPVGFVRWTEQRNFEAVLDLMASGKIRVSELISHRFPIGEALSAYEQLNDRSSLGILLQYEPTNIPQLVKRSISLKEDGDFPSGEATVGFMGAGNYASRVLIPAFRAANVSLHTVVTSRGVSAAHFGKKLGFAQASTDSRSLYEEPDIDTVVIATQHNQHAEQACDALRVGKHVFVEKPMALTHAEIDRIKAAYWDSKEGTRLMVGYNRRFSPLTVRMKELLKNIPTPKVFVMTMNAGAIPPEHWSQQEKVGGGRIIGEACHYIDLMRHLAGCKITWSHAVSIDKVSGVDIAEDKSVITLRFEDGSLGTIHYLANGGKAFPKERIEVFANDAVLQLDNFRKLLGYGWKGFRSLKLRRQNKGQKECVNAFVNSIRSGEPSPIPFDQLIEVAAVSVELAEQLRNQ